MRAIARLGDLRCVLYAHHHNNDAQGGEEYKAESSRICGVNLAKTIGQRTREREQLTTTPPCVKKLRNDGENCRKGQPEAAA